MRGRVLTRSKCDRGSGTAVAAVMGTDLWRRPKLTQQDQSNLARNAGPRIWYYLVMQISSVNAHNLERAITPLRRSVRLLVPGLHG